MRFSPASGIALGPILFIIAILAILAAAIAAGAGGFSGNISNERAKTTAAAIVTSLQQIKDGYDLVIANGGNPFIMAGLTPASGYGFAGYDPSDPNYNAASDPFSPSGGGVILPTIFPILSPFAKALPNGPAYGWVLCNSYGPSILPLGTNGQYSSNCYFVIELNGRSDWNVDAGAVDASVCVEFLKQVGVNATPGQPTFDDWPLPQFANQPMLCG
jgi:type II secretory pathway pseudopilin PulG